MKRKKYLACCLVASMMLGSASPVIAGTTSQEDFSVSIVPDEETSTFEDDQTAALDFQEDEEISYSEDTDDVEILDSELEENYENEISADQNEATDIFSSGEEFVSNVSDGSDADEGWLPLAKENRILYKYNNDEKTLSFKCSGTENVAMPDYKYTWQTDWYEKLGTDTIAEVKKIVIGTGITKIGTFSFQTKRNYNCNYTSLEEVVLADTVTSIGRGAFGADSSLKKINLNKVSSVGMAAFADCALEQVTFDADSINIDTNAFSGCSSLTSVKAKEISELGDCAFQDCTSLSSFEYEGTIKNIPDEAFESTALTTFRFGEVESIGFMAFWNSALKSACYSGTRAGWYGLVGDDTDYDGVVIHCKGEAVEPKAATCEAEGLKAVGTCEVCGEEYSYDDEANKLPALGHEYADTYTEDRPATCTEAGEESKHCTREGCDSRTDVKELPALGHDFVSKVTKKATCTADGTLTYTCSRCNETKTETIKATGHKWSNWKRTTAATVFKPEVQTRKCSACNKSETRNIGKKLAPKATLNASTVTLKVKQSTSRLKVTGLAKGDSVKSWKSSNSKIFTVRGKSNGTCKITGKKRGTAKLQITLASGLKKTVKVKVQTAAVKTSKITVSKNVTVRKGKRVTLKPVVTPFTSRQKVTYTSSNKKIATVSSKGVVTGKKKGTVKITVKSGSKSVKVTVKVK